MVRELKPDALVVDLSLDDGDGFNVVRDVHAHFPEIRVLVLSMHDEADLRRAAAGRGRLGLHHEAGGHRPARSPRCAPCCAASAISARRCSSSLEARREVDGGRSSRLSARELQVISLIGRGLGTREIADNLSLSVKTIETHRLTIKRKLGLETNAQLVQYAIKWHGTPAG